MSDLSVARLRCEYLADPLGIDERAPRLSWQIVSDRRGARQVAWRIIVSSSSTLLVRGEGDLWDSGRVDDHRTTHIVYEGRPLGSRERCHWRVQVWDETGATAVSAPAFWSMGLLSPSDWSARWIAANPDLLQVDPGAIASTLTDPGTPALFRRPFALPAAPVRATLYATARGLFEFKANGARVGCDLFAPEWTDYDKRIHYRTYDLTGLMRAGANDLSALLGDGWWTGYVGWQEVRGRYGSLENSLAAQLELEFADGSRRTIATDGSWLCSTGEILSSDFMMGEVRDARRGSPAAPSGGRPWLPVVEVPPPAAPLVAQRSDPVRVTEELRPVSVNECRPGVFIYDLGQNIAGFVRLRVRGLAPGTRLTLRHGERLSPDGTLYTENLRRARAEDTYVARGDAEETYEPTFTFHGFQYVELSARPDGASRPDPTFRPEVAAVTGLVVHSALERAGHFECSHPGVNRLWFNGLWSQRDNFLSVPTDCPQRDERLGWMGDAQVFLRTASCNMDVAAFFTKWMNDVSDAQTPEGVFPDTAPRLREDINFEGLGGLCGSAGWADAGVIIPYTLWQVYGDRRILERHYDAMVRWVDWIAANNPDGLRVNALSKNYGDWLCIPSDTSFGTHSPMKNLLATAYWADDAAKLSRIARTLGRGADADRFQAMFEHVRDAFQRAWLREDGRLEVHTQTAYLLALAFDLLPHAVRAAAVARLVDDIRSLDWHLSTGFIGISHLNPQLTLGGRADVAYRLLLQESYPSWLYPVRHGATTIWERWNGWTREDGFFSPHMNSFNHYSLGSVGEWLFRHVAGIELDPAEPGFRRLILRPFVCAGLTHATATYRTLHGEVRSSWRIEGNRFTWEFVVPANCSAHVWIPSAPGTSVEGDVPDELRRDGDFAVFEAEAGSRTVRSTFSPPTLPS